MITGECSPGRFSKAMDTKSRLDDLDLQPPSSTTKPSFEDDDPKDREVWSNVASFWYNKAADDSPRVGTLLARPYSLEQISLNISALTCPIPFESAVGSVMTLFNPILNRKETFARRPTSLETILIKAHGVLFTSEPLQSPKQFDAVVEVLSKEDLLENHIRKANTKFKENSVYAAMANIGALFEYGMSKPEGSKPGLQMVFDREAGLNNDQHQDLIALHRQPLHEQHDLFLASQHPAPNLALSKFDRSTTPQNYRYTPRRSCLTNSLLHR